jgi:hypothetical protein
MIHTTHKLFLIRAAAVAALASTLVAQTPDWFPLEVGNTWLYRPAPSSRPPGQESRSISVHGKETVAGREYFQVSYFGREVLLRGEPSDGSVVAYDRASNSEQPWISLGLPVGATFPTSINTCTATGTIAARDAAVTVPAGAFNNVVDVRFQGSCADAGTTRQFYAPNVGLVSTEDTSFAGPVKYELSYYRVGPGTGTAQEVSFTVGLDAPRYPVGSTMLARLTLRSGSPDPIHLGFPSGQSFDLRIYDETGTVGDIWSKDKIFTMIFRDEQFGPGEKTFGVTMPLRNLPPGRYIAEGYLTTDPLSYLGRVSFEITPAIEGVVTK